MTGKKFDRLTVISYAGLSGKYLKAYWNCKCDCGNEVVKCGKDIRRGSTRSCGCLIGDTTALRNVTHGLSKTPEYGVYYGMRNRCLNPKEPSYSAYGGRGISICDRWLNSFEDFLADMGKRPSQEHSLERKNVDGNYCLENCKWATEMEQANNKRSNVFLTWNGETLTIGQWTRRLGLSHNTIQDRLKYGWPIERVLGQKVLSVQDRAQNRSTTRILHYQGQSMNLTQWSLRLGLNKTTVRERLCRGWSVEQALTQKVKCQTF